MAIFLLTHFDGSIDFPCSAAFLQQKRHKRDAASGLYFSKFTSDSPSLSSKLPLRHKKGYSKAHSDAAPAKCAVATKPLRNFVNLAATVLKR